MFDWFKKKPEVETRSVAQGGFIGQAMALRESWLAGHSGMGDLTAAVQSCVSLWEGAFPASEVTGADRLLTRSVMAQTARALALRGEALWYMGDAGLLPVSDYNYSTRQGVIRGYRLTIPDAGGAYSVTALPAEVLHFKIGVDTSTLRRASQTAELLHTLETTLAEIYSNAPIGSQVVPFPESPGTDLETLGRGFKGRRGRVLLRESVNVAAAGGSILNAFGVLPALLEPSTT